jgi:hypothetical protein
LDGNRSLAIALKCALLLWQSTRAPAHRSVLKPRVIGFMPTAFAAAEKAITAVREFTWINGAEFNVAQKDHHVDQLYFNSSKVEQFMANGGSTGMRRFW